MALIVGSWKINIDGFEDVLQIQSISAEGRVEGLLFNRRATVSGTKRLKNSFFATRLSLIVLQAWALKWQFCGVIYLGLRESHHLDKMSYGHWLGYFRSLHHLHSHRN